MATCQICARRIKLRGPGIGRHFYTRPDGVLFRPCIGSGQRPYEDPRGVDTLPAVIGAWRAYHAGTIELLARVLAGEVFYIRKMAGGGAGWVWTEITRDEWARAPIEDRFAMLATGRGFTRSNTPLYAKVLADNVVTLGREIHRLITRFNSHCAVRGTRLAIAHSPALQPLLSTAAARSAALPEESPNDIDAGKLRRRRPGNF